MGGGEQKRRKYSFLKKMILIERKSRKKPLSQSLQFQFVTDRLLIIIIVNIAVRVPYKISSF